MTNLLNTYLNTGTYTNTYKYTNVGNTKRSNETPDTKSLADKKSTPEYKKVKAASIAGSALGIAAATFAVYTAAKKGNPGLKYKNLSFEEKDALLIGASSVLGGLTGGLLADKNKDNIKPKVREAAQQFFGNMACPIGCLALTNKLMQKFNVNKMFPKAAASVAALVGGMQLGNAVINKFNNKIFKEEVKHDVAPEDYLVHVDDMCLTANMVLKDIPSMTAFTSKILPASFIIAGSKTGMQTKE